MGAVVLALALGGCSSGRESSDRSGADGSVVDEAGSAVAPATSQEGPAAGTSLADAGQAGSTTTVTPDQVVVTGSASVRTRDPVAALADLTARTAALGGHIAQSSVSTTGPEPWADAVARVPSARYQDLLGQLARIGAVQESSTTTQDVGQQVADLDARITALTTSITRLEELMARADTTKDLLEAESQLTQRQADLDSLNAQRAWLADQVDLSTLSVHFAADLVVQDPDASLWERSWSAFARAMVDIGRGVVWALPWLALLALVATPVALVVRRRSRRGGAARPEPHADEGGGGSDPQAGDGPGDAPAGSVTGAAPADTAAGGVGDDTQPGPPSSAPIG